MMSLTSKDTKRMEIPNWQLQPIYNAFDSMNYSKAIQLIKKLFIKYPESHLLQALHALALVRTNRSDEALLLARNVTKDQTIDPVVLQTLLYTFRDLREYHDIVVMYETAHFICPDFQDFGDQLFFSLIYSKNFQQMQRVSAKLAKLFPQEPKYFYFNLLSTFLHAINQDDEQKKKLLFTLCKKMLCRALNEDKLKHVEEVLFFTDLLEIKTHGELDPQEEENAIQQILKILPRIVKNTSMLRQLQLTWMKSETDIVQLAKKVLEENNADWDAWKALLKYAPETSQEWEDCVTAYIPSQDTRVYFLTQLEYYKLKGLPPPKSHIVNFFHHWGAHPSFYHDVSSYFSTTPCPDWQSILREFPIPTETNNREALIRCVNLCKLLFRQGLLQGSSSARLLYTLYSKYIHLEKALLPTDAHYAEELLVLAMYVYIDLENSASLYVASVILEDALVVSPYSTSLKMTLIWVYQHLGGVTRGLALYQSLDIKNLQWHTLGYIFTDYLVDLGVFRRAANFLTKCESVYKTTEKDAKDMITLALECGSYSKVPEFHRFYEKLTSSFSPQALCLQQWRLQLSPTWPRDHRMTTMSCSADNDRDYASFLALSEWKPVSDLAKDHRAHVYSLFYQVLYHPTVEKHILAIEQSLTDAHPFIDLAKAFVSLVSSGSFESITTVLEKETCVCCSSGRYVTVAPLLQHAKLTELISFAILFFQLHAITITSSFSSLLQLIESHLLHLNDFETSLSSQTADIILQKAQHPFVDTLKQPKLWSSQLLSDWKEQTHELTRVLKQHRQFLSGQLKNVSA